jgi:plasmid stabilization system protein ParE
VKTLQIGLSEAAVADILEQSDWYEAQADRKLAKRWEKAVTSTLLRISRGPRAGTPCNFSATELRGARRVSGAGFPRHLVFYQPTGMRSSFYASCMVGVTWKVCFLPSILYATSL